MELLHGPGNGLSCLGTPMAIITFFTSLFLHAFPQAGSMDPSFDTGSGANGMVRAICSQPDGRIILGGAFTTFDGMPAGSCLTDPLIPHSFRVLVSMAPCWIWRCNPTAKFSLAGALRSSVG